MFFVIFHCLKWLSLGSLKLCRNPKDQSNNSFVVFLNLSKTNLMETNLMCLHQKRILTKNWKRDSKVHPPCQKCEHNHNTHTHTITHRTNLTHFLLFLKQQSKERRSSKHPEDPLKQLFNQLKELRLKEEQILKVHFIHNLTTLKLPNRHLQSSSHWFDISFKRLKPNWWVWKRTFWKENKHFSKRKKKRNDKFNIVLIF